MVIECDANPAVELLAPAGNMTCLHAAVAAGADAVYAGAGEFNARRGADNFTLDELAQACDYAHLRGRKVYFALNTIVLPSELEDALELARQAYRAGVDAYIVQDIGIAVELHRILPAVPVHASTQMNVHDIDGLRAVAALGVTRITLARELCLREIEELHKVALELGVELETFAHGALCICYSGQCYVSSMVGGRSANRGRCAQACRLPYSLHNRALRKDLLSPGEHLLSPKDLCTVNLIPELVGAGVASLKVEGRMKSPEYVSAVVGVYRAVIDRALAWMAESRRAETDCGSVELPVGAPLNPRATEEELSVLSEAFSRGFTTAYLEGERGNEIMSYGRPNNRGVFAGRVTRAGNGRVWVNAEMPLHDGDVVEFWTNRGHFAHTIENPRIGKQGDTAFACARAVGKGDRVFRVRNAEAAFKDSDRNPAVPVAGSVELHIGSAARMTLSTLDGSYSAYVEGPVVEAARTKAIAEDEVRDHINRMGTTPFEMEHLDIVLDEGVGMGFSLLHKLRASAAEALEAEILRSYHERMLERTPRRTFTPVARKRTCEVGVLATNPACARAAKRAGADFVYVPVTNYRRGHAVVAGQLSGTVEQAGYPKQCIPALPVVSHMFDDPEGPESLAANEAGESRFPLPPARAGFDVWKRVREDSPVLCENLGQLLRAAEMGAKPEAGPHIPVTNRIDAQAMADFGAERIWLSPELSLVQIEELGESSPVPLGLTVAGHTELMVTEHCLLMSQGPCNRDCVNCARRKSPHYLKDRKGYEMPVVTDCTGRSHLYNAVELDIANNMPELVRAGISAVLVDATLMNVEETTKKVQRVARARDIALKSGDAVSKIQGTTSGHLFRGVS